MDRRLHGLVDGVYGPETKRAIESFQKKINHVETGALTSDELSLLRKQGNEKRSAVRFEQVNDNVTGVSVGMPLKLVSGPARRKWGQNWSSPQDRINIDTFRYTGVTLRQICDKLVSFREREVTYFKFAESWCVVSGIDRDGAVIYVRAAEQSSNERGVLSEIRGFSVRLAGKSKDELQMIPVAMSSTFSLIPVGQKPNVSPGPPNDLLRTPAEQLKQKRSVSDENSTGICLNGLGNCPPNASPCLAGSGECPASLTGR